MEKIILVGYPGSQHIVKASKYLVNKYLPQFEVVYLNYDGPINGWSSFCADYLEMLPDEKVIFSLDDYFIAGVNKAELDIALTEGDCVKLCVTTDQEHLEYPVTTQYTIWNRKLLISILRQTTSPWDFEMSGGRFINFVPKVRTCLDYDVHTALSKRWEGIKIDGLKYEDINYIINHKLLC
jgi:hypothetical protein